MSFFKAFVSSVARGVDEEIKDRRDKLEDVAFEISENFDRAKIQAQKAVASAQILDEEYSDKARFVLSKSDEGRKILELAKDSPEDLKIIGQNYLEDTRGVNPKQIDFKKYNKSLASKFLTGPVGEQKFRSLAKARKQPIAEMPEVPEFSQTAEIIAGMEKPSFEKLLSRVEDPKLRTAIQNIRGGMPATEQTKFQGLGIRPEEFVKVTEKSKVENFFEGTESRKLAESAIVVALPQKFETQIDKATNQRVLNAVGGANDKDVQRGTLIISLFEQDKIKEGTAEERKFLPATLKFLEYLRNKKATSFQQLPKEDRDKIIKDGIMKFALGLPDPANTPVPLSNPMGTNTSGDSNDTGDTGDTGNPYAIGLN